MSNPLYSCMVSDPSFPPEPSACAVGPPKSTTPGQYRRELPGHASEQVPMGPPRGVIFRIWSTEMLEALIGRPAKIASSLTALLGPQALDSGLAQARIRIARAPRSFGPIQRQPGPASTAGLRDGQTLATWIALDAADVPRTAAGARSGAKIGKRHGFCSCAAFRGSRTGLLARLLELRQ